ncbi:hypothetical protein PENSPDRAFT_658655 [Peniophora sp. CONT]|nr:hypothetical protein PENSPDRAFT_658655 [Peniophora sp. CONT]
MKGFTTTIATLALAASSVLAQDINFDSEHNATTIIGSWTSGSKDTTAGLRPQTGLGFANPAQMSFTYPTNAGVSYAFSEDYHYELARFRYVTNGSHPDCITGTLVWAHGTYELLGNGSIILTPMGDGFQQVQVACRPQDNFIQIYNQTEMFQSWRIFLDSTDGPKLHLFQFDGTPVAPLFQVSATPNMLPTQLLRNVTESNPSAGTTVLNQKRSLRHMVKRFTGF